MPKKADQGPATVAERSAAYRQRRRETGSREVLIWVPADDVEAFRQMAAKWIDRRQRERRNAFRPAAIAPAPALIELVFRIEPKPPHKDRERLKQAGFNYHQEARYWSGTLPPARADEWELELVKSGAEILAKQRRPGD